MRWIHLRTTLPLAFYLLGFAPAWLKERVSSGEFSEENTDGE